MISSKLTVLSAAVVAGAEVVLVVRVGVGGARAGL